MVGTSSLAGCETTWRDGEPPFGSRQVATTTTTGTPGEPDTDDDTSPDGTPAADSLPLWARWAYERGTFGNEYRHSISSTGVADFQRNEGYVPDDVFDPLTLGWPDELPGIDRLSIGRKLRIRPETRLLTGSFTADEIIQSIRKRKGTGPIARAGEYRGYRLFDRTESRVYYAVRDGEIVEFGSSAGRSGLEALLDIGTGHGQRVVRTNPHFARVARAIGAPGTFFGLMIWQRPFEESEFEMGRFVGLRGRAESISITGERTRGREAFLFETQSDVDVAAVRDWLEHARKPDTRGWPTNFEEVSIERADRVVIVTGRIPTAELTSNTL